MKIQSILGDIVIQGFLNFGDIKGYGSTFQNI